MLPFLRFFFHRKLHFQNHFKIYIFFNFHFLTWEGDETVSGVQKNRRDPTYGSGDIILQI